MKYLKTFESETNSRIKKGDYVLMKYTNITNIKLLTGLSDFICNTIGIVYKTDIKYSSIYVKYDNVPDNIKRYFTVIGDVYVKNFVTDQIVDFSKSKKLLIVKMQTIKFNI